MEYVIAIAAGLLIVGTIIYFMLKKTLSQQLNLRVELAPSEVERGGRLKIRVYVTPKQATKVDSVNGSLFCRRYDEFKNSWSDKSELPGVYTGTNIARIQFSFAQNVTLEANKEQKFVGVISIPEEGLLTEVRGIIQVHWFVCIYVKIPGQPIAEIQEELIVVPVMVTDEEAFEEEDIYDPFYDINIKKGPDNLKKSILAAKEANKEAAEEGSEGFKIISEEEKAKQEEEEARKVQSQSLTVEAPTHEDQKKSREKFKVSFQTPFDPTKHQKPTNVVTPEDYIKMMTAADGPQPPAMQEKGAETGKLEAPGTPWTPKKTEGAESGKLEAPGTPWSPKKPEGAESGKLEAPGTPWSPKKPDESETGKLAGTAAQPAAGASFTPRRPGSGDDYMPDWAMASWGGDTGSLAGGPAAGEPDSGAFSSDTGKLTEPSKAGIDDIYKQRHFVAGEKRKPQNLDDSKVPEQYRQKHKLQYGSKFQKIKDENSIPEQYRSGKIKPAGDLFENEQAGESDSDTGSLKKE
ncbi:MAG: hypothetical protein LWY06_05480 [Firmicutes bacterium]|nr:hypothetical protein [Bacillota bacterium]